MPHVTVVFLEPITPAANLHVPPRGMPTELGEIVTEMFKGPDVAVGDG
jgi:hypothetical protein